MLANKGPQLDARDRDGGRRGGAGRAHHRPVHLRQAAAPAITTSIKRPKIAGVCDVCGVEPVHAPRRRQARDGEGAARGLSRPDRADPALLPGAGAAATVDGMAAIDEVTRQIEAILQWLIAQLTQGKDHIIRARLASAERADLRALTRAQGETRNTHIIGLIEESERGAYCRRQHPDAEAGRDRADLHPRHRPGQGAGDLPEGRHSRRDAGSTS